MDREYVLKVERPDGVSVVVGRVTEDELASLIDILVGEMG